MSQQFPVMTEISTPRLELEILEIEHASLLFEGLCDEQLYQFIDASQPESVDALRSRYQRLIARRSPDGSEAWLNWAVLIRAEHQYAGYVQATISTDQSAEIAYVLFRNHWGCGYGREAVMAMMRHLKQAYDVKSFRAHVDTRNGRSIALLESLGFQKTSCRIGASRIRTEIADELEYAI